MNYWPGLEQVGGCCSPVMGAEITKTPPPDDKNKWLIRGGAALAAYWLLHGRQVQAVAAIAVVAYLVKKDVLPEAP